MDNYQAVLQRANQIDQASVQDKDRNRPQTLLPVVVNLDVARDEKNPYEVNFQFKSFVVISATDENAYVYLKPSTPEDLQGSITILKNWSMNFERQLNRAYLFWPRQAGKTMTILFSIDAQIRPGSMINQITGGVTVSEGSSASNSIVTLNPAITAPLFAASSTRKNGTAVNDTAGSVFVGATALVDDGSGAAGANKGIEFGPGEKIIWKNTAALYAYSAAGGTLPILEEF